MMGLQMWQKKSGPESAPAAGSSAGSRTRDLAPPLADTTRQVNRRTFLLAGTAAAALAGGPSLMALLGNPTQARAAAATPATAGQWTAPFNLGMVSIHAVLLHTGKVLLFSWPANNSVGSCARLWDPVSGSLSDVSLTYQRVVFCAGTTVLADGRIFLAGGHIYQGAINDTQGVINTTLFDPASNAWTEGPLMSQARWYPTTMQLGDNEVIICAGTLNS